MELVGGQLLPITYEIHKRLTYMTAVSMFRQSDTGKSVKFIGGAIPSIYSATLISPIHRASQHMLDWKMIEREKQMR